MTKSLLITLFFKKKLTDEDILNILNTGLSKGVRYYDYIAGESYFESPCLKINKALNNIKMHNDEAAILCRYKDISFFLYLASEDNLSKLSLWDTGYPLKKEFLNGVETVEFDLQRYIRLMLDLVKGLEINKINAKIEWD